MTDAEVMRPIAPALVTLGSVTKGDERFGVQRGTAFLKSATYPTALVDNERCFAFAQAYRVIAAARSLPLSSVISGQDRPVVAEAEACSRVAAIIQMAKYLITGIAGFIGSAIARELLQRGQEVRGLDNLSTGKLENIAEISGSLDFRHADLLDKDAVGRACMGVDYVFHEAAIPSVPKSVINPVASHEANINGTLNLLMAARAAGVKRVVYASSSSLYGETPTLPKREEMKPDPISPYAVQKLAGEMYMISFARVYGFETVSLRYFNVFGPRQDPTSPYSGVLSVFSSKMLAGESPVIYGDGEQSRDFTYVDNVVEANLLACRAPAESVSGRAFNIACGLAVTLNQTYALMQRFTGFSGPVTYAEARNGDIKHSLADISEAKHAFGYDPKVSFEEGLKRTVEWYRGQQNGVAAAALKR